MQRNPATLRDLARLIAHKTRMKDPDELMLLFFERAIVEIQYITKLECAAAVPAGPERERFEAEAGYTHGTQANWLKETIVGTISGVPNFGAIPGSIVTAVLGLRRRTRDRTHYNWPK